MTIRRFVAVALLAAMASAASAQTSGEDPKTRITLTPVNVDSDACTELVRLADKDPGMVCAVSGTITPAGKVDDASARCQKSSFENSARRCFNMFTLKKQHAGQTGPVCAALLFVPVGRDAEALDISFREYTPCTSLKPQN